MTEPDPTPRPPTLLEALVPVVALIVLVGLSFLLFGDAGAEGPDQVALAVATMVAVLVATRRGHSLALLSEAAWKAWAAGWARSSSSSPSAR